MRYLLLALLIAVGGCDRGSEHSNTQPRDANASTGAVSPFASQGTQLPSASPEAVTDPQPSVPSPVSLPASFMDYCVAQRFQGQPSWDDVPVSYVVNPLKAREGAVISWERTASGNYILRQVIGSELTNARQEISVLIEVLDFLPDGAERCGGKTAYFKEVAVDGESGSESDLRQLLSGAISASLRQAE